MFRSKWYERFIESGLRFLQVHLFICLASLPIIGVWGLPLSSMSIVGNFIFTPWIILFVICSTLIFFTEILHIPHHLLIVVLEKITSIGYFFLKWGKKKWIIGVSYQMFPFTIIVALCALGIICHKRWGQFLESIFLFIFLYVAFIIGWNVTTPCNNFTVLSNNTAHLYIVSHNKEVMIYDEDFLRRIKSAESWVEYTLIPSLLYNTGSIKIATVVLTSFSPSVIKVLAHMVEYADIQKIVIPYFSCEMDKKDWRAFFKMCQKARDNGTAIERFVSSFYLKDNKKSKKLLFS